MYKLEMQPPALAVLRLLVNRLEFNDDVLADWLRRGRRPYEKIFETTESESPTEREAREVFFAAEDRMPEDLRRAAYRVEARRSLIHEVDESVVLFLISVIIAAFVTGLTIGGLAGVAIAVTGLALAAWARRVCERRARDLIEWRQGVEPAIWALYYPLQIGNQVEEVAQRLREAGETTVRAQWEARESGILRDNEGKALPGQDEKLRALTLYLNVEVPSYFRIDSGRLIGQLIYNRAPVAAALVRTELMHQLWSRAGSKPVADKTAEELYSYLMQLGERFIRLPRPPMDVPGLDTPLASIPSEKYFNVLLTEAAALRSAAHDLARGEMPEGISVTEELPSRHRVALQVVGVGMAVSGLFVIFSQPAYASLGNALISVASVLVPGTLGKILEKTSALKRPGIVTPG